MLGIATLGIAGPAWGVIVSRLNGPNDPSPVNTTAPTDDPGWSNVSSNYSTVYLGNQWVITARHTYGTAPPPIQLGGGTYSVIPGTEVQLTNTQSYSSGDSRNSDIVMFRIRPESGSGLAPEDFDPTIKPITISSATPTVGTQVTMIGASYPRVVNVDDGGQQGETHYTSVNTGVDGPDAGTEADWTWTPSSAGSSNQRGFVTTITTPQKTWGQNAITSDFDIETRFGLGRDADNNTVFNVFDRFVVTLTTRFDEDALPNEAQAAGNDSGGAVFYKNLAGQWVLGGVMHSILQQPNQPLSVAMYGNYTAFSDFSQFNYRNQIQTILSGQSYSVMGDANLDGVVSGNGTGSIATDDVSAFIAGWNSNNGSGDGDIYTWQRGDFDQNGLVDLLDFAILRQAVGGTINASVLLGASVPEPSAISIGAAALVMSLLARRLNSRNRGRRNPAAYRSWVSPSAPLVPRRARATGP